MDKNKGKVVIVVICLAAAGALLAYQMGWIGGSSPAPASTTNAPATKTESGTQTDQTGATESSPLRRDRF